MTQRLQAAEDTSATKKEQIKLVMRKKTLMLRKTLVSDRMDSGYRARVIACQGLKAEAAVD